jgi:hypothetical protein
MNRFAKALMISLVVLSPAVAICAGESVKGENAPSAKKVYKVGDLFKEKASLDKQKVIVKGKVVKVASGIMNKNWFHLQDGSGDPGKKTNDLAITTTQELPAVGKTVTVSGTLHKDKDFGYGYKYEVIIEEATIKP